MSKVVAYFSLNNEQAVYEDYILSPGILFKVPHPGFEKLVSAGFLRKVEFEGDFPPGVHLITCSYEQFLRDYVNKSSSSDDASLVSDQSPVESFSDGSDNEVREDVFSLYKDYSNEELYQIAEERGWVWSGKRSRRKAIEFLESLKRESGSMGESGEDQ